MHPTRVSHPDVKAITVFLASTATPERGGLPYLDAVLPAEDRLAAARVVRDLGALPPRRYPLSPRPAPPRPGQRVLSYLVRTPRLTVAELLDGKKIDCPPLGQVKVTFKRATKARYPEPETVPLPLAAEAPPKPGHPNRQRGAKWTAQEIGRASCRERVCSVV